MPQPSLRALRAFEIFFLPWMRRRIEAVRLAGLPAALPDAPLLVVANHISWWDGFTLREIHRRLRPRAPLRVVMTERELRQNRVLGWIAAVALDPGSPASVLRTFRGLRRLCHERPDAVVLFFPQGRIWPSHRRPLGFARGITTLARMLAPVTVLPVALHIEPLATLKPTLFASAGSPLPFDRDEHASLVDLETAVTAEADALLAFLAAHGEGSGRAWPDEFDRLPRAQVPTDPTLATGARRAKAGRAREN